MYELLAQSRYRMLITSKRNEERTMTLHFPLVFNWDHLSKMRGAEDAFGWDADMVDPDDEDSTLPGMIRMYSEAFHSSAKLTTYLEQIGYVVSSWGVTVRNEAALLTAHTLFNQIMAEYDDSDMPRLEVERFGHKCLSTPTWALFDLGGDDDVDYCGTQPSCLTELLMLHHRD